MLDIKLPGSSNWHRIGPALARELKKAQKEEEVRKVQLLPTRAKRRAAGPSGQFRLSPTKPSLGWHSAQSSPNVALDMDLSSCNTLREGGQVSPSREITEDDITNID